MSTAPALTDAAWDKLLAKSQANTKSSWQALKAKQDWPELLRQAIWNNEAQATDELVVLTGKPSILALCNGAVAPLACLSYISDDTTPVQRQERLATAEVLIRHGYHPNELTQEFQQSCTSGMFRAVDDVNLMRLMLANGGDPNLEAPNGQNVLSSWCEAHWRVSKRRRQEAMQVLDVLLAAGLNTDTLIHRHHLNPNGPRDSFLRHIWIDAGLRQVAAELIDRGFDPWQAGDGSPSLADFLNKKLADSNLSPLLQHVQTAMTAQSLRKTRHVRAPGP